MRGEALLSRSPGGSRFSRPAFGGAVLTLLGLPC
jgi:hypothetical protein